MLEIREGQIRYKLTWLEKIGAFGPEPGAKLSHLVAVSRKENPWTTEVLRGIRAPGTGFPFLIMLGTLRNRQGKDFCVIYRKRPVLILEFKDEKFKRWIIPASEGNSDLLEANGFVL